MYISFTEGMIFSWFTRAYEKAFSPVDNEGNIKNKIAYYLSKPLYSCSICMSSVWGAVFVYFSEMTQYGIISSMFVIHVVLVAGLNYLIAETIENLKGF